MILYLKVVLTNLVPAVAVIREGQVLFKIIGRKTFVDRVLSYFLNFKIKI